MTHPKQLLDIKVPMRDGINLAANIYFPEGESPFPVLLNRTPYIKDTASAFPTWAPNFNTGENIWEETTPIIAQQVVYHSPERPSQLIMTELTQPRFVDAWLDSRWHLPG